MAESGLPAGLEKLKIDLKRDLDDCSTSTELVNPFSFVSNGARKKIRKSSSHSLEERHSCTMGIFGDFLESTSPATSCQCNVYVPSKFQNNGKRFGQGGNLLQVKPTTVFKKSILKKSKLNFLRLHGVTKQSCQQVDPLTLTHDAKVIYLRDYTSSEAICKINSSKCSIRSQPTAIAVQDFKSLILSSEKQISSNNNNPIFDTSSFKSLQNSKLRRRHCEVERLSTKSEEDDLVSSVSKKLSVTGITPNNNASCSQEARLTANAYCDEHDISIDELASYFEDFVHIPKKMSLMAEQMYI